MSDNKPDAGEDEEMDRASRVRNRRSRRDRRSNTEDPSESDESSKESQREQKSQTAQTTNTSQTEQMTQTDAIPTAEPNQQPIKDRTHETFYLRDDLRQELRRVTGQTNLDFDLKYGTELEKNRHLRPLLLYLGAKQMEEMNITDIKDILDNTDILDTTEIDE